jgi:hypothetical protein
VIAASGGRLIGVLVAHATAGRVGWLGLPEIDETAAPKGDDTAALLVRQSVSKLTESGCRLVQSLVSPDDQRIAALEAAGFCFITDVIRLSRSSRPPIDRPAGWPALEYVPYSPGTRATLLNVMDRTYRGSLDLPELDGLRPIEDVVASYQACGSFRPELWLLAREGNQFVGCLLLNPWPEDNRIEIEYMGVVPEARGRRLGLELCVRALDESRRLGVAELSLSVDARNEPAKTVYKSAGFEEIERRRLLVALHNNL